MRVERLCKFFQLAQTIRANMIRSLFCFMTVHPSFLTKLHKNTTLDAPTDALKNLAIGEVKPVENSDDESGFSTYEHFCTTYVVRRGSCMIALFFFLLNRERGPKDTIATISLTMRYIYKEELK